VQHRTEHSRGIRNHAVEQILQHLRFGDDALKASRRRAGWGERATLEVLEGTQKGKIHRIDREETIMVACVLRRADSGTEHLPAARAGVEGPGEYYLEDEQHQRTFLNNRRLLTRSG